MLICILCYGRIFWRIYIYPWPHTHPVPGDTLNLFQKTRGLGSGNWCEAGISEVAWCNVNHHLGTSLIPH
jgi:hypothetical protein